MNHTFSHCAGMCSLRMKSLSHKSRICSPFTVTQPTAAAARQLPPPAAMTQLHLRKCHIFCVSVFKSTLQTTSLCFQRLLTPIRQIRSHSALLKKPGSTQRMQTSTDAAKLPKTCPHFVVNLTFTF